MPELHFFQKRKTGFQQCPKTNLLISDLALLPYNTLWSMMTDWVTEKPYFVSHRVRQGYRDNNLLEMYLVGIFHKDL